MKTKLVLKIWLVGVIAICAIIGMTFSAQADITTGLIGHWKLDDGASDPGATTAVDSSPSGFDGTLINGPVWTEELVGPALTFDGSNDCVDLGDIDEFEFGPDDSFSIALWIRPVSREFSMIFGRNNDNYWNPTFWTWNLRMDPLEFGIGDGISHDWLRYVYTPRLDEWQHITIVVGVQGDPIKFYVNGELRTTKVRTIGQLYQTDNHFMIGDNGRVYSFNGSIRDVRVYKKALTQDDISGIDGILSAIGPRRPEAKTQDVRALVNTPKHIALKAEDVNFDDTLTYRIETPPAHGSLDVSNIPEVIYTPSNTPSPGYTGPDSFTFIVNDGTGTGDSNTAIISIDVTRSAFPGAQGFGATAIGGRGGDVVHVTNLEDNGDDDEPVTGSLRWALKQTSPKIIVFDVGGVIEIQGSGWSSPLKASGGDFTIAGQTAPGGIVLMGNQFWITHANNFIIRHLRVRGSHNYASSDTMDSMDMLYSSNFIIDHVSLTGASDETLSSWYGTTDFTVQWSSIEESALWGQGGAHHEKGNHNFGVLFGDSPNMKLTLHHNLFASHAYRSPKVDLSTGILDFRNNVIYNWEVIANQLSGGGFFNVVGNVYLVGPSTLAWRNGGGVRNLVRGSGNFYPPQFLDDPLTGFDESNLWYETLDPLADPNMQIPLIDSYNFVDNPFAAPLVTPETAQSAYDSVLNKVGA